MSYSFDFDGVRYIVEPDAVTHRWLGAEDTPAQTNRALRCEILRLAEKEGKLREVMGLSLKALLLIDQSIDRQTGRYFMDAQPRKVQEAIVGAVDAASALLKEED